MLSFFRVLKQARAGNYVAVGIVTIDTTGSGNRLPIALWRRPVDVDLLHEGLLDPHSLPESVASQLGIAESAL